MLDNEQREKLDGLMARLAAGDRAAIRPAFEVLGPIVHRHCKRLLGGRDEADDAAQQALEKVFAQVASYDPQRAALPWVLTIATWECKTVRRRWSRSREVDTESNLVAQIVLDASPSPEDRALRSEQELALAEAMSELSAQDQETLAAVLEDLEPGARPAVGATFRKRRERAVTRLRALWRELYG